MKLTVKMSFAISLVMILLFLHTFMLVSYSLSQNSYNYEILDDNSVKIIEYTGADRDVNIPKSLGGHTVTVIGEEAFINNEATYISIPSSVTTICRGAFYGCTKLYSINIPKSVTRIESYAFYNCSGISAVTIDNIADWCGIDFCNVYANPLYYADRFVINGYFLTYIEIPNGVKSIGRYAFCGYNLKRITIPATVEEIGENAFYECNGLKLSESRVYISDLASWCNIDFGNQYSNPLFYAGVKHYIENKAPYNIEIPNGVEAIKDYAFINAFSACDKFTVSIPNSVKHIGKYAFYGCKKLANLSINESVTDIDEYAFYGCSSLSNLIIPDSINSICDSTFEGCTSLAEITIPNSVTSIGSSAFGGCTSLTSVTISNGVSVIGDKAFDGCLSLESVIIADSVTDFGNMAFNNCDSLTIYANTGSDAEKYANDNSIPFISIGLMPIRYVYSIKTDGTAIITGYKGAAIHSVIPSIIDGYNVTEIGNSALKNCTLLESVTISKGITFINGSAFSGCTSLSNIIIPDSVNSISWSAFSGCTSLSSICVDSNNAFYSSLDGVLFNKDKTELLCYPAGKRETIYSVPNSVISIGKYAFRNCAFITSIIIPDSVISICDKTTLFIGNYSFDKCVSLSTIYGYLNSYAETFAYEKNFNFIALDLLPKGDLNEDGDVDLVDYSMAKGVFYGESLSIIPFSKADYTNDRTLDAFDMFYFDRAVNNFGLTDFNYTVTSGNNAKITGYNASNVNVKIPARIDGYSITNVDQYVFKNNTNIKSVKVSSGIRYLGYGSFLNCTALETVELPDTITIIGTAAFKGCTNLTKINIPASVTSINANSFADCPNLKIYGEQGTYAETYANNNGIPFICFSYEVISGNNIKITGYNGTESEIVIPATINGYNVTLIYNYAFKNNTNLEKVTLSSGIKAIGYGAFLNCTNLEEVVIADGATSVGTYAFKGCSNLCKITIPSTVTSINANSFTDCPNVVIFGTAGSYAETYANNNGLCFATV